MLQMYPQGEIPVINDNGIIIGERFVLLLRYGVYKYTISKNTSVKITIRDVRV